MYVKCVCVCVCARARAHARVQWKDSEMEKDCAELEERVYVSDVQRRMVDIVGEEVGIR